MSSRAGMTDKEKLGVYLIAKLHQLGVECSLDEIIKMHLANSFGYSMKIPYSKDTKILAKEISEHQANWLQARMTMGVELPPFEDDAMIARIKRIKNDGSLDAVFNYSDQGTQIVVVTPAPVEARERLQIAVMDVTIALHLAEKNDPELFKTLNFDRGI